MTLFSITYIRLLVLFSLLFVNSNSWAIFGLLRPLKLTPIVETTEGPIQGKMDGDTQVFLGIRYRQPPVGALRWKPPKKLKRRDDNNVYAAVKEGPVSLQMVPGIDKVFGSEDCLFLNIWVPPNPSKKRLPVMVWIHGGAYIVGGGYHKIAGLEVYNAKALAEKGEVIVVSFNYRLGAMGYLAHEELQKEDRAGGTGNYGLLDQVAALQWVNENIENFSGDKNNVTSFGESAGGHSNLVLLAIEKAKGLFRKVIPQSAPPMEIPLKNALEIGNKVVENLARFAPGRTPNLKNLRELDGNIVTRASQMEMAMPDMEGVMTKWAPVIDGVTLKYSVAESVARGLHNKDVSVLIGTNEDEMNVLGPLFMGKIPKQINRETFYEIVRELMNVDLEEAKKLTKDFTEAKFESNRNALKAFSEEVMFKAPTLNLIKNLEKYNPGRNYAYRFTEKLNFIGAGHGMELLYLFPNNLQNLSRFFWNYNPLSKGKPLTITMTALKQWTFSDQMIGYWTRFASSGDPNGGSNPLWKPAMGGQNTMILNSNESGTAVNLPVSLATKRLAKMLDPKIEDSIRSCLKVYSL